MLLEEAFPSELTKSASSGWIVRTAQWPAPTRAAELSTPLTITAASACCSRSDTSREPRPSGLHSHLLHPPVTRRDPARRAQRHSVPGTQWRTLGLPSRAEQHRREEFTMVKKTSYDPREWSRIEMLVDASAGTARMAVAQPVGNKAEEVLAFRNRQAARLAPSHGRCITVACLTSTKCCPGSEAEKREPHHVDASRRGAKIPFGIPPGRGLPARPALTCLRNPA
jgi:hypothetical protein